MRSLLKNTRLGYGLIGYWPLNSNSNDLIGGNNGTDTSISYVAGKVGEGASFDGTNSYITIGTNPWAVNLSISCWIKVNDYGPTSSSISGKAIVFKAPDTGYVEDYSLMCGDSVSGKYLGFVFGNNNPDYHVISDFISTSLYDWQHIVALRNSGISKIYRNGVLFASSSYSFTPIDNGHTLFFGRNPGTSIQRFDGQMDEIAIWNRELSENEVKRLYNGGRGFKLL